MNIKKCFLLFLILTFCGLVAFPQSKDAIRKVVIDAGHGGKDPGALGSKSKEKDVALSVALQLGSLIKEKCPDVEVYYTRSTDVFVELKDRSRFANNKHADFFISIHCNSSEDKNAHGVETYVMGLHKTEANLAVARKENASILLESDYQSKYEGFNPNSPESYVIFSLYSGAYLSHSAKLAAKVQENLVKCTKFTDRKVQQAGFWVLHQVAMPSILVELGFISNPKEEEYLTNKSSQKEMAQAICDAFVAYKTEMEADDPEGKSSSTTQQPASGKPDSGVRFKVQFCSLPNELPTNDKRFAGMGEVGKYKDGNIWKYTVGNEKTYASAEKLLEKVKVKYSDAFIVAFKNGKKIPLSEARKLAN